MSEVPRRFAGCYEDVRAADQAQRQSASTYGVQGLPSGQPGRAQAAQLGIKDAPSLEFFVLGDSGGIVNAEAQMAVAYAMAHEAPAPAFVYHLGDVDYYTGDGAQYEPQFYEPYEFVAAPIVAIPGNHDGTPNPLSPPPGSGIQTFMDNFCASTPQVPPADPQFEFRRHTQCQPYCDWTLALEAVTICGVWSNVPSGGHLFDSQTQWLTGELRQAPSDRPLIVALHHPPVSVDAHHGGSARMSDALDACFEQAGRCPNLVLSGHVHDFQHFVRSYNGVSIDYVVCGNGGYRNLHRLASDATPGMDVGNGFEFRYGDDQEWGYLALSVSDAKINARYTAVTPGSKPDGSDAMITPDKYKF
jgi:hypothetical protein